MSFPPLPLRIFGDRLCGLCCLALVVVLSLGDCSPALSLRDKLFRTTWVAYAPTNYDPNSSPPVIPSEESIREDLEVLRTAGFDGLFTYGANIPAIVTIAEEVRFNQILLGIWNPGDAEEMSMARAGAESDRVIGIIVGNEGLMFHRYDWHSLKNAIEAVRRETGKPISSTEVVESYFARPELVDACDFIAANAHPYFHNQKDPDPAVAWTLDSYENLVELAPNKPVLFKEVGLPSDGDDGLSETAQMQYYEKLCRTQVKFVFFEAFDALFKAGKVEQSWGLFRADRSAKSAAAVPASCGKSR